MQKKNLSHKEFFNLILDAANKNHGFKSVKAIKRVIFFFFAAYKNKSEVNAFLSRVSSINGLKITSEKLGVIEWPYIHNHWNTKKKLDKIASHYEIMHELEPELMLGKDKALYKVIDFDHISEKVTVAIDQAQWFVREGELVINVFKDDLRVASIAFVLAVNHGVKVAYLGAIQGIHQGVPAQESLDIYRDLTKDFQGLRPRSLLLEVLKVVLTKLKVEKIFAVSDKNRHHRHAYFGSDENTIFKTDYNTFWEEHSGVLDEVTGFYELPIELSIKDLAEIPSKKRSMYKRRYEIINALHDNVFNNSIS